LDPLGSLQHFFRSPSGIKREGREGELEKGKRGNGKTGEG